MKDYKRLGDHIREVNVRNRELKVTRLLGVGLEKKFFPSIANIIGTDLSNYKVIRKGQFGCKFMSVGRDGILPVSLLDDNDPAIISSAYYAFEVKDPNELLPEYLMMWLRRPEFDRELWFYSGGDVRGGVNYEAFCDMPIIVPTIARQREIVLEYETLTCRIRLNEQMIAKLEETAQALYRKMFVDGIDKENLPEGWRMGKLSDVCSKIGSGATPKGGKDSYSDIGISLIRSMNVFDFNFCYDDLAHISDSQAKQLDSVTVEKNDILINITGASVARCCMVPDVILPARVNQHVMIVRSKEECMSYYLLCVLCSDEAKQSLLGMSQSGSTREAITKSEIESFKIIIPPTELLKSFSDKVGAIFSHVNVQKQENSKLTELQSLLLARMGK